MPKPIPIYTDHDEQYRADSCRPLAQSAAKTLKLAALSHGHYPGKPLSSGVLNGLKMAGFWDAEHDQDWGLDWHRNEGIEITYLESGRLDFSADQKQYQLKSGELTILRPWQLHRVGNPWVSASRLHWIILDLGVRRPDQTWRWPSWLMLSAADVDQLAMTLRQNEQPVWSANAEIRRCFQAIAHAIEADVNGSSVSRLTVRLNELFVLLLDTLRDEKVQLDESLTTTRRTVQLFLEDLRAQPQNLALTWTVEEMARSCGLGISQFTQHVRSLVNMTPMHYLTDCRIDRATTILKEMPRASITDIALGCGFSSGQYFATRFKRRFGATPREFRSTAVRMGGSS